MSIYGHRNINVNSLKRWVTSLSVDSIDHVDIGGLTLEIKDEVRINLEMQLNCFSQCIAQMNDGDDWRSFQELISPAFYNAFIRLDNSSIKMGDYYECLIKPSNVKTYKKIIAGFDYLDIGAIHIKDSSGNAIASIGPKSDLIWAVFYDYFVNDHGDGSITHVYSNHKEYLSIQLFNIEQLTKAELISRVNEILIHVSMMYDMEFQVFKVNPLIKSKGNSPVLRVEYTPTGFEEVPMYYLTNANNENDARFKFLSYYQVIEYFFVRAQNKHFLKELRSIDLIHVNHNELRKVLAGYKKVTNEREALRLVLNGAVDINNFKTWLSSTTDYWETYCNSADYKIDISKDDKKIISNLVERVYGYRCSIAHAKGDVEEYIAIPSVSNQLIAAEIPLIKYLAYETIKNWSEA